MSEEIFEIEDYTLVSPLERAVDEIEKILRSWNLAGNMPPQETRHAEVSAGGKILSLALAVVEQCGGDGGAAAAVRYGLPVGRGNRLLRRLGLRAALILSGDIIEDSLPAFPLTALSLAADAANISLPLLVLTGHGATGRAPGATFTLTTTEHIPAGLADDSPATASRLLCSKLGLQLGESTSSAMRYTFHLQFAPTDAIVSPITLMCEWDNPSRSGTPLLTAARRWVLSQPSINDQFSCPLTAPLRTLMLAWQNTQDDPLWQQSVAYSEDDAWPRHQIYQMLHSRNDGRRAMDNGSGDDAGDQSENSEHSSQHTAEAADTELDVEDFFTAPDDEPKDERVCKGAPIGSLTHKLALIVADMDDLRSMLAAWQAFVDTVEDYWEQRRPLPFTYGEPDLHCSLLHQKLQMLNCCVRAIAMRGSPLPTPAGSANDSTDDDAAFVDAPDTLGRGRRAPLELSGINSGEQLFTPFTQDHEPVTEDVLADQVDTLAALGTTPEAAEQRAQMQSKSLLSDMQAFKAANPGAELADFVRWHSPRDWTSELGLSPRMAAPGNMWANLWASAKACTADQQQALWDADKCGDAVIAWLNSCVLSTVLSSLWTVALDCVIASLRRSPHAVTATETLARRARGIVGPPTDARTLMDALVQHAMHAEQEDAIAQSLTKKLPRCERLVSALLHGDADVSAAERAAVQQLLAEVQKPVTRETVVNWEASRRPASPAAARLYLRFDEEGITCALTAINDIN